MLLCGFEYINYVMGKPKRVTAHLTTDRLMKTKNKTNETGQYTKARE